MLALPLNYCSCHRFLTWSGHASVASHVGITAMECVMCMHALVDLAWQLCSNIVLTVLMYVELTGHEALIVHVLLSKFPISFCFVLIDHLWSCNRLHHWIWNHVRNETLFSFYSYEKQQQSYGVWAKFIGRFLLHLSLLAVAAFAGVV